MDVLFHNPSVGCSSDIEEEIPMTMQIGMVGTDGVLIASDTLWMNSESTQYANVRHTGNTTKIEIDYPKGVAIACARNMEVAGRIAKDLICEMGANDWDEPGPRVESIANKTLGESSEQRQEFQCTIITSSPEPRLFHLHAGIFKLQKGARCQQHSGKIIAGDMTNAAAFWAERYYPSTEPRRPIRQLVALSAHLIIAASALNSAGISGLEIVLCDASGIHRLSDESIRKLELQVAERDESISTSLFGSQQQFTYAPNVIR